MRRNRGGVGVGGGGLGGLFLMERIFVMMVSLCNLWPFLFKGTKVILSRTTKCTYSDAFSIKYAPIAKKQRSALFTQPLDKTCHGLVFRQRLLFALTGRLEGDLVRIRAQARTSSTCTNPSTKFGAFRAQARTNILPNSVRFALSRA